MGFLTGNETEERTNTGKEINKILTEGQVLMVVCRNSWVCLLQKDAIKI